MKNILNITVNRPQNGNIDQDPGLMVANYVYKF